MDESAKGFLLALTTRRRRAASRSAGTVALLAEQFFTLVNAVLAYWSLYNYCQLAPDGADSQLWYATSVREPAAPPARGYVLARNTAE